MEEDNFEATLKNEFLMEALELANECEDAFIELERNPENSEIIDEIFRIAHTFKGGALTVGFESLGHFSHIFENVLMNIREGKLKPTSEVVDVLLEGNDILGRFVNALRQDFNATIDTTQTVEKLKNCLEPAPQQEPVTKRHDIPVRTVDLKTHKPNVIRSETFTASTNPTAALGANPFQNLNVLICDDEEDILSLLESIVKKVGVTVFTAKNGLEGLEVFKKTRIDSIISDLRMPEMNGIEFIREIRKINAHVPVIFCSGFAERDDLVEFINLNTFGFIDKPFENHKILSLVKNSLVMNALKTGIVTLSQLNYNTYMLMSKILRAIECNDTIAIPPLKSKLESKMSEVSSCTEKVLKLSKP